MVILLTKVRSYTVTLSRIWGIRVRPTSLQDFWLSIVKHSLTPTATSTRIKCPPRYVSIKQG